MRDAARMASCLSEDGMFRGELLRLHCEVTLVESLFDDAKGFLTLARKLFSEVRRVDLGSHLMPLAMHREHAGNYTLVSTWTLPYT
jgi:hypothetical protein